MFRELWSDKDIGPFVKLCTALIGVMVLVCSISGCRESMAGAACKAKGYSGSDVTYGGFGSAYCIRRVGLVDEVVPL